jgi:hypothetical protein
MVTDSLQVVPTRLIQVVRNKLSCYELVFINLLRADIRLVGTTCYKSLLASSNLFIQDYNNLFQTCQQLGTSSANTSC